ncbi:MAG: hypothetical protein NTX52_08445, partial [Planctomycetota bacterium]|nr:hypothetical protein [Planctomycetota bacterium]
VLGEEHPDTLRSMNILTRLVEQLGSLGMEKYKAGAYEEALATLKRVDEHRRTVLKNESQPRDIAYIAMALHKLGREKEAEAALNRLRGLFEDSKHTHEENYLYEAEKLFAGENSKLYSVWEYIESGKLEEASQLVKELQSLEDPNISGSVDYVTKGLARAYYNRGKSRRYEEGTRYAKAIADYEVAVRFDPNYARAFSDLAYLQAECPAPEFRDAGKAVKNATKACDLTNWKDHRYVGTLAAVYAEVGDFASAIKWQKEAIDLLPKDNRANRQANYEVRLKLYESGKPYRMGNLWSFSTGDMVGWWKFDETEGHIAIDSSGNGLEGKLLGDAHIVSDPIRGNVLNLDGNGDWVDCGKDIRFNITEEITISAWIKVNKFDKGWQAIITKGGRTWRLQRGWNSSLIEFACTGVKVTVRDGSPLDSQLGSTYGSIHGNADVNDGKWHHLAGVYDGSQIYLYVDGILDKSSEAWGSINTNDYPVLIGENAEEPGRCWNGLIDDIRIYSYALNEAQIKALFFETGGVRVTTPRPANGANVGVTTVVKLGWNPSKNATAYQVYFGTDPNKMALLGKVKEDNFIQSPKLEKFQRYYWRVDEERADGSTVKGELWS